ncbi:MAG TPA: hypothetical protein VEB18_00305 [Candidatus Paceibacterota bacterium]|nr:hypothetical protein [Candidatus Paceibacterota bacterium]
MAHSLVIVRSVMVLVIVVAFVGWFAVLSDQTDRMKTSAQQGMMWLRSYSGTYGNPGVLWVLTDINERYCKSEAFSQELTDRFVSSSPTPVEQAYFLGFSDSNNFRVFEGKMEAYDRWLLSALACKIRSLPVGVEQELLAEDQGTGYDLTHRYLGLSYLEGLQCLAGEKHWKARELRTEAARSLYEAARAESFTFSDLAVERAAFLLWGGHGSYVTHDWIDTIMRNQNEDGGWGASPGATISNPHTTALAVWTLVQTTHACPL